MKIIQTVSVRVVLFCALISPVAASLVAGRRRSSVAENVGGEEICVSGGERGTVLSNAVEKRWRNQGQVPGYAALGKFLAALKYT